MRVTLSREPKSGGHKVSDDIFGELDFESTEWFNPREIMIHADPECSENPEGDVLMFDSVDHKLKMFIQRLATYAEFDGGWRMHIHT